MKTLDLYSKLQAAAQQGGGRGYEIYREDPELQPLEALFRSWEMDLKSTRQWFASAPGQAGTQVARQYLEQAPEILRKIEAAFGGDELPGLLIYAPSYGEFDGFARYDRGGHAVLLGIDFPDADFDYLRALTAHELSHVHRDHRPDVWRHIGKPLSEVSRSEYLEAGSAQEHLVSEGLATLFSQALYPEIPPSVHHYYDAAEWQWCEEHGEDIHRSLLKSLQGDGDVWSYYSPSRVAPGSPSRTQYYWAAKILSMRLEGLDAPRKLERLVELHAPAATDFREFLPE